MIKQSLYNIFSTLIAFLVLFSTVSFTIEKHFCGEVLVGVSIFGETEKCCAELEGEHQEKSCCKDEIKVVKGQDELKTSSFEDIDFSQQQFITSYVYSYISLYEGLYKQIIPHKDYSPPNLVTDIQVLDQVFLI